MKQKFIYSLIASISIFVLSFFYIKVYQKGAFEIGEWAYYGHDVSNNKFSELTEINTENVKNLKINWQYKDQTEFGGSMFFNPLVVKNKMIAFLPSGKLAALNPENGNIIWEFAVDTTSISTWTRSATYHQGKNEEPDVVYFVYGATLYAIDASNGSLVKAFGKNGKVDFYDGLEMPMNMRGKVQVTANAPGIIYNDFIIYGCKVPDELPSISGDIRAFNLKTGQLAWVFHTIPKKGEYGADTWAANARSKNGGANCWGGMALDEKRGIVYVPTASPSFDFYGADRPGQNLFANCLLALDAKTGKRIWHFQTTHHDLWDRDNGSPPNLVTVEKEGKKIDAVSLVTKMGYLFLFDRENGKPIFPIKEIAVPTKSTMPGEKPWPTQPYPTKPEPFSRQAFKEEYFSEVTTDAAQEMKEIIKKNGFTTGLYDPPSITGGIYVPAAQGGANWGGAMVNPNSNILFVNATDMPWILKMTELKKLKENNSLSGENLYKMYCTNCHGADKKGTTIGPNISKKVLAYSAQKLTHILVKGAEPMPSFKNLPKEQLSSLVAYLKGTKAVLTAKNKVTEQEKTEPFGFSGYDFYNDKNGIPAIKPPYGTLNAIDLNKGTILWKVPIGADAKATKLGIKNSGLYTRGGGIATAGGLIFIAGTWDNKFRAFSQKTGELLWETLLPGIGSAIPCTYAINGKQYVTISVSPEAESGYRGGYVTFSL